MARVMIAEDELLIADMIAEVLADNGYEISGVARSVAEAVELGERHQPDLAVIDLRLADGGGGNTVGARLRRAGNVGILYTTGGVGEAVLTADDGDACLRKPFALADLVAAVKIVEQIVTAGASDRPFPRGFEMLRPAAPPIPGPPELAAAQLKIARLLRQQAALAAFGSFAFRESDLGNPGRGRALLRRVPGGRVLQDLPLPARGE